MFNYFLPGKTKDIVAPGDKLDRDVLKAVGLADVLADCSKVPATASVLDVRKGCGGVAGCVIVPVRKYRGTPDVLFSHERQHWQEVAKGQLWLGYELNAPVAPTDLERFTQVGGYKVADAADREWLIPIARAPVAGYEFGALPQTYTFDLETGEPQPRLAASHVWLWELAGEIRDWFIAVAGPAEDAEATEKAAHKSRPFAELVKYAARILGVNYRVGLAELNALAALGCPLLSRDAVVAICQTTYGNEVLNEVLDEAKKKPPASASTPAPSFSSSKTGDASPDVAPVIALPAEP